MRQKKLSNLLRMMNRTNQKSLLQNLPTNQILLHLSYPNSKNMIKNATLEHIQFTITGGLRGSSELSNGFELKNELLELLELLDAAGVRSCIN